MKIGACSRLDRGSELGHPGFRQFAKTVVKKAIAEKVSGAVRARPQLQRLLD